MGFIAQCEMWSGGAVPPFHMPVVVCVTPSFLYLVRGGLGLSSLWPRPVISPGKCPLLMMILHRLIKARRLARAIYLLPTSTTPVTGKFLPSFSLSCFLRLGLPQFEGYLHPFVFLLVCVFLAYSRCSSVAEPSFSCPIEYTLSPGRINRYI